MESLFVLALAVEAARPAAGRVSFDFLAPVEAKFFTGTAPDRSESNTLAKGVPPASPCDFLSGSPLDGLATIPIPAFAGWAAVIMDSPRAIEGIACRTPKPIATETIGPDRDPSKESGGYEDIGRHSIWNNLLERFPSGNRCRAPRQKLFNARRCPKKQEQLVNPLLLAT
jgi:hypothetical protein